MNRVNLVIVVIATAVLLAVGSAQTKPGAALQVTQIPCPSIGRYQIIAAEHVAAVDGGAVTTKDMLRIDTVTGETSQWVSGVKNGKSISFWKPVDPQ